MPDPRSDLRIKAEKEDPEKRGLLRWFQRAFSRQEQILSLGLLPEQAAQTAKPAAPDVAIAATIDMQPVRATLQQPTMQAPSPSGPIPLAVAPPGAITPRPAAPAVAMPEEITWVDDRRINGEILNTRQGSGVPSPTVDDMVRYALWGDLNERASLCKQIDIIIASDPIAQQSREESIEGALGQKCTQRVEPAKGWENDPIARDMAAIANALWQDVDSRRTLDSKKEVLRSRLDYGNAFIEVVTNIYGVIESLDLIPPYAIRINSDHQLRFRKDQDDAYEQYDALDLTRRYAKWPEGAIIHSANRKYRWQRHGIPYLLSGLGYANALIRDTALLPDAREAGQPQTVIIFKDSQGNPVDPYTLGEYFHSTRKARKDRGEPITANDEKILNGAHEAQMLAPDGSFWRGLDDIRWFAAGVAMLYGDNLARLITPETVNRATMASIDEMRFYRNYNLSISFSESVDKPIFSRMIALYNGAAERFGVARKIDPRKVCLITEWHARRTPERLKDEATLADKLWLDGVISLESAIEVACRALELDPETEKKRKKAEMEAGIGPPKRSVSLQAGSLNQLNQGQPLEEPDASILVN